MGIFKALGRLVKRTSDMGEGAINNAADKMLTANEASIRAQYRKVRDDLAKNLATVRSAVANLMAINEEKKTENASLEKKLKDLETMKLGAVRKFKETNDVKYQEAFANHQQQAASVKEKIESNNGIIAVNDDNIEKFKRQLTTLQEKINSLKSEEDQAVADITTSKQITKINDMMSGVTVDVNMQGLNVIEEARKKAIANAKLSSELSNADSGNLNDELMSAGSLADDEFARMLAEENSKG